MATFEPAPTYADPVMVDEVSGKPRFNPLWLRWFLKLSDFVTSGGSPTNLNYSASPTTGTLTSSTGTDTTVPLADGTNSGLMSPALYTEASAARSSRGVDTTDDLIVDLATKGLVLKDTQATPHYWRVTITTLGVLTTTDLGTTKP